MTSIPNLEKQNLIKNKIKYKKSDKTFDLVKKSLKSKKRL